MAARLRAHLEAINAHFDAASEPCLRKFSLDEETVRRRPDRHCADDPCASSG